jgi:hypothetical protein
MLAELDALRRSCSWVCLGLCRVVYMFHNHIHDCEVGVDVITFENSDFT